MLSLLVDVLGPVAVLVALGAIVGPRYAIDADSLSRLAYWFLGPAFMFDILHDAELALTVVLQLIAVAVAGMAAAGTLTAVVLGLGRRPYPAVAAAAMTAAYGNVGNAGLAISTFALGPEALPVAGVFMLAINTTGMMLGVGLAHGRNGSLPASVGEALRAPMTIASLVAIAVNALSLTPPVLVDRSVGLIAGALIPTMLFTLGIQLRLNTRLQLGAVTIVPITAKLMVAPLVAAAVAYGLSLSGDLAAVAVIQSAMPPAVFCMVVAMEHDFEPEMVTATVAMATLAAVATLPVVLTLVV